MHLRGEGEGRERRMYIDQPYVTAYSVLECGGQFTHAIDECSFNQLCRACSGQHTRDECAASISSVELAVASTHTRDECSFNPLSRHQSRLPHLLIEAVS